MPPHTPLSPRRAACRPARKSCRRLGCPPVVEDRSEELAPTGRIRYPSALFLGSRQSPNLRVAERTTVDSHVVEAAREVRPGFAARVPSPAAELQSLGRPLWGRRRRRLLQNPVHVELVALAVEGIPQEVPLVDGRGID